MVLNPILHLYFIFLLFDLSFLLPSFPFLVLSFLFVLFVLLSFLFHVPFFEFSFLDHPGVLI